MAESQDRLHRLLSEKDETCCQADVEHRIDQLQSLTAPTSGEASMQPMFAVLGNQTRYRLVRTLVAADEELCVCELEPLVDVSDSAVSHALSDLVETGLATRRKAGNWRYYDATQLAESLFETATHELQSNE